ncbi:MAG: site-2 protease family protein [Phycisphaerae bacterium]
MGWQDRSYYRDPYDSGGSPWRWLLYGRLKLFELFGITVYAHASLIVLLVLLLIFGPLGPLGLTRTVQLLSILFIVVLLHEFGHCFAARRVGGSAEEIVMTPIGGLAMAMAPNRPWPRFVTVAGGPLVNVAICLVTGVLIYALSGRVLFGPWSFGEGFPDAGFAQVYSYAYFFYVVSWALLVFNLLPMFPLDGGQLLQTFLWKPMGYYKSMLTTMNVGMVTAVVVVLVGIGLLTVPGVPGGLLAIFIAVNCFINCLQMRRMLIAEGPWGFQDEEETNYAASLRMEEEKPSWRERMAERRAEKQAEREAAQARQEQEQLDQVLVKISRQGEASLSGAERKFLKQVTQRRRASSRG